MAGKLVLVDGHSILNRAFYGVPDLTNAQGLHTNAIYGFLNILFKILDEEQAEYLAVAFDVHAPTFRHEMYEAYKGTRKPMPQELREQVPVMKQVLHAMGVCTVEQAGLEADDILGTLAKKGEQDGCKVALVSGDRDLLQIASDHIQIRIPKTKGGRTEVENYYAADVLQTLQVTPQQFIELKALMGDTADNIPGVPKVGQKTATELMLQYGSLEGIYAHLDEVTRKSIHDSLAENRALADLSLRLATIKTDCELPVTYEEMRFGNLYTKEAYQEFQQLGFKNFLGRFQLEQEQETETFRILETEKEVAAFFRKAHTAGELAFQAVEIPCRPAQQDSDGQFCLQLENVTGQEQDCLCLADGKMVTMTGLVCSIPGQETVFCRCGSRLTAASLIRELIQIIAAGGKLISFDLKNSYHFLEPASQAQGALFLQEHTEQLFDVLIAAYLINPLNSNYQMEDIAQEHLGVALQTYAELFGKKTVTEALQEMPDQLEQFVCRQVSAAGRAASVLQEKLKETGQETLFREMEMPLSLVLYHMEKEGIMIRPQELTEYGESLAVRIRELETSVWDLAGEEFNLNSPKQLAEILFGKLQLPGGKKTKTGYSTSADVLDKLAPDYEIVAKLLEYRGLSKLKSTYADGLMNYVDQGNRIHTTFNQTITATGRISSTNPNLQNIPMRTELGRQIRRVFVARPGCVLMDADYSQIELRVLASMSGDKQLIEAYRQDADIHRMTAAKVFHVAPEEVTPLMRRNAKAVNFGIVYGISSFGLSQDLSISRKEAAGYIDKYFELYPEIKTFLDRCVEDAKKNGYTVTMFGRRRPMPELTSSNFMQRSFGERVAKNAPIQGTAADIIKKAMIQVDRRLRAEGLASRLILQIHDELLIETVQEETQRVQAILSEEMKQAAQLQAPLEIDLNTGENWYDAH